MMSGSSLTPFLNLNPGFLFEKPYVSVANRFATLTNRGHTLQFPMG